MPKLPASSPSLKDFLQRSKVIRLYRSMLRTVNLLDLSTQADVRQHIREEFRRHAHETDPAKRQALMATGAQQLKYLEETALHAVSPGKPPVEESPEEDSRLGQGWPWQRAKHAGGHTAAIPSLRKIQVSPPSDEGSSRR